jgi:hypothetical protein
MRRYARIAAVAALSLSLPVEGALAATPCAKPQDIVAVQAAAVQQELMVAALTCEAIPLYNQFVTTYQPELQATDKTLKSFFRKLNTKSGTADYHAFKTKLANMASQRSIANITTFCDNAKTAFTAALDSAKSTLAAFVSTQPVSETSDFTTCEIRVAGGNVPGAPRIMVPTPREKPSDTVLTAQGAGLATAN